MYKSNIPDLRGTGLSATTSGDTDWFKKAQEDLEYVKRLQGQPKSTPVTFKDLPKDMQEYLESQTKTYYDPNKPRPDIEILKPGNPQYDPPRIDTPPIPLSQVLKLE